MTVAAGDPKKQEALDAYVNLVTELLATWIRNQLVKEAKARAFGAQRAVDAEP